MISLDEARAILLAGIDPLANELVSIAECGGRVLGEDVIATRDQPPQPVSAMDGYAVRAADAVEGARLQVIGESPAGTPFAGVVGAGHAVRIATGGVVPEGADCVVIQEDVACDGDLIRIARWSGPNPAFVRQTGCDFVVGERLARRGEPITPARHALIAAANLGSVAATRRSRIAVFPSGNELREPGAALAAGEIIDSASHAIADLAAAWGAEARRFEILPDDAARCEAALSSALEWADVVVTIGGASVGGRDLLRPVLLRLGAELLFERIAVQPGKPTWHARFPDGPLVLGLPGNPASAFVCAHVLLKPLLFRLTGRDAGTACGLIAARAARRIGPNGGREAFLRAHVWTDEGYLTAEPLGDQDSSLVTRLAAANALIRRLPNAPVAEGGELVEVMLLEDSLAPS